MNCSFCGRENIPLKYESINTGLKIYVCPKCGRQTPVDADKEDNNGHTI